MYHAWCAILEVFKLCTCRYVRARRGPALQLQACGRVWSCWRGAGAWRRARCTRSGPWRPCRVYKRMHHAPHTERGARLKVERFIAKSKSFSNTVHNLRIIDNRNKMLRGFFSFRTTSSTGTAISVFERSAAHTLLHTEHTRSTRADRILSSCVVVGDGLWSVHAATRTMSVAVRDVISD